MPPRTQRPTATRSQAWTLSGLAVLVLVGLPVLLLGASPPTPAPLVEWRGSEQKQPGLSLDRAVELAERRYQARVVRASVSEAEGRKVYVLKLLSEQGRVWTVRVDAQTGAMN